MKIVTFNTWQECGPWQERWEVAFKELEKLRPDFACFQELFNPDFALEVQKRLGFSALLFPKEHAGLVVYANQPALSWGVVQLAQSPLEEYGRYALWSEFEVKGVRLLLVNTHLSWKLEDGESRVKQADDLLRLVEKQGKETETLLCGDLNAPPHTLEIRRLLWDGKFRDVFHRLHQLEEKYTWDNRNPYAGGAHHKMPDRRIDYILARNWERILGNPTFCDLVFTKPNAKGVFASDHFGVLTEFE
jgi:endonuclease/exonuclease/phosphatase family metal-dependent hydrolase